MPALTTILVGTLSTLVGISMGALLVLARVALLAGLATTLVTDALVGGILVLFLIRFVWHYIYVLEIGTVRIALF